MYVQQRCVVTPLVLSAVLFTTPYVCRGAKKHDAKFRAKIPVYNLFSSVASQRSRRQPLFLTFRVAFKPQSTLVHPQQLSVVEVSKFRFEAADFEKDQDLNFHIDFISATSNMRAWNYR